MQEDNKFFRFVWRVNAVLLALAGLAVVVLVSWELVANLLRPRYEPVPEGNFRPVPRGIWGRDTYSPATNRNAEIGMLSPEFHRWYAQPHLSTWATSA